MNVKTDGMVELVARLRATIRDYGPDDWFQGCSHGGGIYMRDLRPVLDAALHHAELVEAGRELFTLLDELDTFNRSGETSHGSGELMLRVGNALDKHRILPAKLHPTTGEA